MDKHNILRICIISPEFPPSFGGIETYSSQFARELQRRGHQVVVYTIAHSIGEVKIPGVKIRPDLKLCSRLDREVLIGTTKEFDVWHVMNAAYAWVALILNPVVVSVHGNDFLKPYIPTARFPFETFPFLWRVKEPMVRFSKIFGFWQTRQLMNKVIHQSAHIFANSKYTEKVFLEKFPNCTGKTTAPLVGVDESFFGVRHCHRKDTEPLRLLTISRLSEPRKNVDRILEALAILKFRHKFCYTIVGDGFMREQLVVHAKRLGLEKQVKFVGNLDQEGLLACLSRADLMVLTPSVLVHSHEGFGIVYLEAAASGVPSLATLSAGPAEAINEGVSGFFVNEPTVDEISLALDKFLSNKIQFNRTKCRDHAKCFRWELIADRILDVYEEKTIGFDKNNSQLGNG